MAEIRIMMPQTRPNDAAAATIPETRLEMLPV